MTQDTAIEKQPGREVTRTELTRGGRCYRPNVDILERADELVVLADLPGATADDIDVQFEKGTLILHARVADRRSPPSGVLSREYSIGDFYRTFQVSEVIDPSRITAECADGVLTLHLPKVEAAKPRKISVAAQ